MLLSFVFVIPRTEMFVLNANVLNSSILESKLFIFRCPKYMPLSLNTFYVSLSDEIEGRLSSKVDSVSRLLSIGKEPLWNGKFSNLLQSLHISRLKKTVLMHFLYALRSHLVQRKLYLMLFFKPNMRQ